VKPFFKISNWNFYSLLIFKCHICAWNFRFVEWFLLIFLYLALYKYSARFYRVWNFIFLSKSISLKFELYYTIFEVADFKYNNSFQNRVIKTPQKPLWKILFLYGVNKEIPQNDEPHFSFCFCFVWHLNIITVKI